MNNHKIVFITHALAGGGSEHVLSILANYFSNVGYEVSIISRTQKDNQYYVNKSVYIEYIKTKSHISFILKARNFVKKVKPSTVISFEYFYNMCSCLICFNLPIRLIISERNDPARVGSGFIKGTLRNLLYRLPDILVCQTEDAKKFFPSYIQKKSVIILNPVMPGLPQPYKGPREKVIVNFCRLNKQKNLSLLIRAFNDFRTFYPDYILHIYGDGPEKASILQLIDSLELNNFVSVFPNCSDIHKRILNASMYISTSDFEGLSNSMLEALAIGLPTICTDCPCGGARMVIEDGVNGILIPVGDKKALVEKMCILAKDSNISNMLSQNAAIMREKLDMNTICKEWKKNVNN